MVDINNKDTGLVYIHVCKSNGIVFVTVNNTPVYSVLVSVAL